MSSPKTSSGITLAEWLQTGVVVHFADGKSALFPLEFLEANREIFLLHPAPDSEEHYL